MPPDKLEEMAGGEGDLGISTYNVAPVTQTQISVKNAWMNRYYMDLFQHQKDKLLNLKDSDTISKLFQMI